MGSYCGNYPDVGCPIREALQAEQVVRGLGSRGFRFRAAAVKYCWGLGLKSGLGALR